MKSYVLALDLGGTNSVLGVVDPSGKIVCTDSFKTQVYPELDDYVEQCAVVAEGLYAQVGGKEQIEALGIGAPDVNYWDQTIENATNLPWKGVVPLASKLEARLGIRVRMTNDAKAAALGEMLYGAAQGMKDFIMLTLGTGVGSGIVVNGQLVYGKRSFAGELGHTVAVRGGRPCNCGRAGCLETYTSAIGVARTAREFLANQTTPSLLRELDPDTISSKDIFEAAEKGDQLALDIFEYTGKILGQSLADFVAFSAPEAIVLFGGLANAGDLLLEPIRKRMNENVVFLWKDKVKVLKSSLPGADAAVLGASALGWK